MRHATILLSAACLFAVGAVGCSKSYDENAKDCAAALSERTGSDSADNPTVKEAEERIDALDNTLADMVRMGHADVAKDAADALEEKTQGAEKSKPEACEPLNEDDYTALRMAKAIGGLGWTGEGAEFDKNKMLEAVLENE